VDQHIKDILKQYVKSGSLENGITTRRIEEYWTATMGSTVTSRTHKMQFFNGILTIYFDSAALKNEMFNNRDKVRQIINEYLEGDIVREVVVR
jgi:hypothetical protein